LQLLPQPGGFEGFVLALLGKVVYTAFA
jgi:hypothetical protein